MLPAVTNMAGQSIAFPDVCLTPAPPAPSPVPIPYPNIAICNTMNVATSPTTIFIGNLKPATLTTQYLTSTGDEPGVAGGGVVSHLIKGPCKHLFGSVKTFFQGKPASTLLHPVGHNGPTPNIPPGATVVPSQIQVLIL